MKRIALKTYGKIISVLLALLGLLTTACEPLVEYGSPVPEYGSPTADFIIKGKVTDTTSTPLKNILVAIRYKHYPLYNQDSIFTDNDGNYEINYNYFPDFDTPFTVIAEDIDGSKNGGNFQTDSISVQFSSKDQIKKGSSNWYFGIFEKDNQDIKLKEDNPIAMYEVMATKYKENEKE